MLGAGRTESSPLFLTFYGLRQTERKERLGQGVLFSTAAQYDSAETENVAAGRKSAGPVGGNLLSQV